MDEGKPIREQVLVRALPRWDELLAEPLLRDLDEIPAVLAGRLEAVRQDRDALRTQVRQLLDERAIWVQLLQRVMTERDAMREAKP